MIEKIFRLGRLHLPGLFLKKALLNKHSIYVPRWSTKREREKWEKEGKIFMSKINWK